MSKVQVFNNDTCKWETYEKVKPCGGMKLVKLNRPCKKVKVKVCKPVVVEYICY